MTEEDKKLDPKEIASAQRRLGFVAILWWIAAFSGGIGLLQHLGAGWARLIFIGLSWVLAIFFTFAWWQVRRGNV